VIKAYKVIILFDFILQNLSILGKQFTLHKP